MSTADQLKSLLSVLSDQVDAERAAHASDLAAVSAVRDANEQALVDAVALVQTLSAKLPPLPPAEAALAPNTL